MSRVTVIDPNTATGEAKLLLDAVQGALGMVPNLIRVLANSPAALSTFWGCMELPAPALSTPRHASGSRCPSPNRTPASIASPRTRLSAGKPASTMRKFSPTATVALPMRRPKQPSSRALVDNLGQVTSAEFDAVRAAGHSDAEIIEIITHVAMNIFTNLLGKATQVEIDFPKIELSRAA